MKLLLNLCLIVLLSEFGSANSGRLETISRYSNDVDGALLYLKSVLEHSIYTCNYTLDEHIKYVNQVHENLETASRDEINRHMALSINTMQYLSLLGKQHGFDLVDCFVQFYSKFGEIASEVAGKLKSCLDNYVVEASKIGNELEAHFEVVEKLQAEAEACKEEQECLRKVVIKTIDAVFHEPLHIYDTSTTLVKRFNLLKSEMTECNAILIKQLNLEHSGVMKDVDSCVKIIVDKELH